MDVQNADITERLILLWIDCCFGGMLIKLTCPLLNVSTLLTLSVIIQVLVKLNLIALNCLMSCSH